MPSPTTDTLLVSKPRFEGIAMSDPNAKMSEYAASFVDALPGLRDASIAKVTFAFSGYGDQGQMDSCECEDADGKDIAWPDGMGLREAGEKFFDECAGGSAWSYISNNEGGAASITLDVAEGSLSVRVLLASIEEGDDQEFSLNFASGDIDPEYAKDFGKDKQERTVAMFDQLETMGAISVAVQFSGAGDSGAIDCVDVLMPEGETFDGAQPVSFASEEWEPGPERMSKVRATREHAIGGVIEDVATLIIGQSYIDWWNNTGGFAKLSLDVSARTAKGRVVGYFENMEPFEDWTLSLADGEPEAEAPSP